MTNFLLLMLIPILISCGALIIFKRFDSVVDFIIQIGVVALVVAIGLGIAYEGRTSDTDILDGAVTGKARVRVSCEHSYPCHCHTVPCGKNCVETVCDTCYRHPYDVDWNVYATLGFEQTTTRIDRLDSQGLEEPPRWDSAYIGEPYALQENYTNYIKANPDSVLLGEKGDLKTFGKWVPAYPEIYDYYKVNHVLNMGVPNVDVKTWNWLLSEADKTLGPKKELNLIVVLVPTDNAAYAYAFRDSWLGGKKNDADILIGSVNGHKIDWADVVSWTTNKAYIVDLRDDIMRIGNLDQRDAIVKAITKESEKEFVRMHMKNYRWLTRNFQPSGGVMIFLFILGTILSLGLATASIGYHKRWWGETGTKVKNEFEI